MSAGSSYPADWSAIQALAASIILAAPRSTSSFEHPHLLHQFAPLGQRVGGALGQRVKGVLASASRCFELAIRVNALKMLDGGAVAAIA
jgi:hypothetical protein